MMDLLNTLVGQTPNKVYGTFAVQTHRDRANRTIQLRGPKHSLADKLLRKF